MACLIATPAIAGALVIGAIESGLLRPAPSDDDEPPAASLATAIVEGQVERAYAFIRAGQDPNQPIEFQHPDLTGDRQVMVSPLLLAVASHSDNAVSMLLSVGVRRDLANNRFAACLATQLGYEDIVQILVRDDGPASKVECPQPEREFVPPLLAFVE